MSDWTATLREAVLNRRMLICLFTGFSSGLPLYLLLNLVPAWLKTEQVDLKAIGLFALVQLPYTWKFIWSPFIDRYALPLGRAVQHTGEIDAARPVELLWVFGAPAAELTGFAQAHIDAAGGGAFAVRVAPGVKAEVWGDAQVGVGTLE